MNMENVNASGRKVSKNGRRIAIQLLVLVGSMPLAACGEGGRKMRKDIVLNVEMYSYLDRPIHDIIFNDTDLGVMNSYGGTGTITGVRIPFGTQSLYWTLGGPEGMHANGEIVSVRNSITIGLAQIPPGTRYLGLHLYPDYTAEVTFAEFIPDRTPRGEKIIADSE
jgi:hypothetical protein